MQEQSKQKSRPLVNRLVSATNPMLTAIQKWTLVCLLDHQNNRNGVKVWPSVSRLAKMTGFSDKSVRRALHDLQDIGFIRIEEQHGLPNLYYLNLETIENYAGQADQTSTDTPVTESKGVGQRDQRGRTESPGGLVTETTEPVKNRVKEPVDITGSESNREKREGLRDSADVAASALDQLRRTVSQ